MNVWLYDHREEDNCRFSKEIGSVKKFTLSAAGLLRIPQTEFLYSLNIHLTPTDMDKLRDRLNELHEKKVQRSSSVLTEVQEILKRKKL